VIAVPPRANSKLRKGRCQASYVVSAAADSAAASFSWSKAGLFRS
jgi:hypothetical protein